MLNSHLTHKHNLTPKEYRIKFPGSKTVSKETSEKKSKANIVMWKTRDRKIVGQQMLSGRTEESNKKMAESQKIRLRNLSKEQKKINKAHMKKMAKSYWNEDKFKDSRKYRAIKISNTHTENFKDDPQPYINRMNNANKIMHEKLRNFTAEELDKYLSNSFLKIPKIYKFEYKNNVYGVRSSYEEIVLKRLVDLNLNFKYEPTSIRKSDGKYYRPDFIVNDNIVIEVKSEYWLNRVGLKDNKLRKESVESKGWKYILLLEKEIFEDDLEILNYLVNSPRVPNIN